MEYVRLQQQGQSLTERSLTRPKFALRVAKILLVRYGGDMRILTTLDEIEMAQVVVEVVS